MAPNSEFVAQFYEIEGDLISERKKNFFKLLRAQSVPLTEEDLKTLIPRTYLESLFQIDIFIYFKLTTKLSEVLKGGNEVFVSKILRHPFLLKQIIGDVSAHNFVNDFLPCMSYAMRWKVLKKISFFLEESQMDLIVSCVHQRYGFYFAKKLLHTCSPQKFEDYLSKHDVILKPRQVRYIFDKNPELLITYLQHYKSVTGMEYIDSKLAHHIIQNNPKFWLRLQTERLSEEVTLGHRTSEHYIKDVVSDLQSDIMGYRAFLKLSAIIKCLHGHFKEIYLEFFPKDVNMLSTLSFSHRLLKYYPKQRHWDLFAQTYKTVFGKDVLDDLLNLNDDFITFLPNKAAVYKWADLRYKETKHNDVLRYCDPKLSIPLVKEKINVTSDIYERSNLLQLLMMICTHNNDSASLEQVLKYISVRHRNEDVMEQILKDAANSFKFEELSETHWTYIKEIIGYIRINKKWDYHCTCLFSLKYVQYLILHRKPFKKEIIEFIKDCESFGGNFNVNIQDPIIEKKILIEIIETYPKLKLVDEDVFIERQEHFVNMIFNFNATNPGDTIELQQFPYLFSYITSLLSTDNIKLTYGEQSIVDKIICHNIKFPEKTIIPVENAHILKIFHDNLEHFALNNLVVLFVKKNNRSEFEQQVLEFFWENLLGHYEIRYDIIPWFIDNEPRTVVPHLDRLLEIDSQSINMTTARLLSHLAFDRKIITWYTEKLKCIDQLKEKVKKKGDGDIEVGNEVEDKIDVNFYSKIMKNLSILLSTKEYIEIVLQWFLPDQKKMDAAEEELREFYALQREVAGSFTKVQEPGEALPVVMGFCAGDYLQAALRSLYSIFYRTPERLLYPYIEILSNRAVSVRKHALFLSCELLPYDYVLKMIQKSNETNISSQKHIFTSTLKYLKKNPCEELLNQVVSNLYVLDKNDTETFKDLIDTQVPEKYTILFKEKCWYFFEDLRKKDVDVKIYLESLLQHFINSNHLLESLPVAFYRHIIANYFKDKPEKDCGLYNINHFVCLILRLELEQSENFNIVFNRISLFKDNDSTDSIKAVFNEFHNFARSDITDNYKIDSENNYHIELFKQHWYKIFTPIEWFDEHVIINLLYLKSKSSGITENYAKEVSLFLEELITQYGSYIYNAFKDLLAENIEREKYIFLYNILTFKDSTVNYILVIDLIESHCCDSNSEDIRYKIIDILKSSNEPVVAIYFNKRLGHEKPLPESMLDILGL